jgi:hypothetical protein
MTALVRTFTPQGFVVAADGREYDPDRKVVISENVRKIFRVEDGYRHLAFSVCGAIKILTRDRTALAVNLVDIANDAAMMLADRKTRDLTGYAFRFSRQIYESLGKVCGHDGQCLFPDLGENELEGEMGKTIARLMFDGYQDGTPFSATIRLFHQDEILQTPEVLAEPLRLGFHRMIGPPQLTHLLWNTDDERLAKFRGKFMYAEDITLEDAIERSATYLKACSDEQFINIDKSCCTVGGHIHMAKVTPARGFEWVKGFEPLPLPRETNGSTESD